MHEQTSTNKYDLNALTFLDFTKVFFINKKENIVSYRTFVVRFQVM